MRIFLCFNHISQLEKNCTCIYFVEKITISYVCMYAHHSATHKAKKLL